MIRIAKSNLPGLVKFDGDSCTGLVTLEELRQLASIDFREEAISLADELESPVATCERASENMRALAEKLKAKP